MKIGIGTTVLSKGLSRNHLDGIGVYTQQLLNNLHMLDNEIIEVNFSKSNIPFSIYSGISAISTLPFYNMNQVEKKIDLFHATDHHIPKLKNTPLVATIMDIIPLIHPEWASSGMRALKNFAFKKSISWAQHLITISEYSKLDLVQKLNINPDNISVVPLGVNEMFFHRHSNKTLVKIQNKYGVNRPYYIHVGTIQPRKNLDRMLEAFFNLPKDTQKETQLVIIGKYGWGSDALLNKLESFQRISKNILWLKDVSNDELVPLIQGSISLIYPSLYEGFGLPILEGFAAGVPVISSNITSIPEVASSAALLVNPYSTEEISNAMMKILDNDLRISYIEKGNRRVLDYSWQQCVLKHLKIYEKMVLN